MAMHIPGPLHFEQQGNLLAQWSLHHLPSPVRFSLCLRLEQLARGARSLFVTHYRTMPYFSRRP